MSDIEIYKKAEIAIKNAHGIYLNHENRLEKAQSAIKNMLDKAENGMDEDTYKNAGILLKKLSKTVDNFNEERSPVTKAARAIVTAFTTQENTLDYKKEGTDAYRLKQLMDKYIEQKEKEKREKEELQRQQLEKEREINTVRVTARSQIESFCGKSVQKMKENIDSLVDKLNLDNFDDTKKQLTSFDARVPEGLLQDMDVEIATIYVKQEEKTKIYQDVLKSIEWQEFKKPFEDEVGIYLHETIDKLPSLKRELEEIAIADKKKKELLLAEKRDREERERKEKDKEKQQAALAEKQRQIEEMKKAEMQAEFEFGNGQVESSSELKSKKEYEIKLTVPAGLIDLVRFWASQQKFPMEDDKLMRWSFGRMKSFAEKMAKSDDVFIKSEYVTYKEKVKSKF